MSLSLASRSGVSKEPLSGSKPAAGEPCSILLLTTEVMMSVKGINS